jgi:hypothetical protein
MQRVIVSHVIDYHRMNASLHSMVAWFSFNMKNMHIFVRYTPSFFFVNIIILHPFYKLFISVRVIKIMIIMVLVLGADTELEKKLTNKLVPLMTC